MTDNSIVIVLTKKGFGKAPSFTLKISEDEKVVYEGFENVKILGKYETFIDKDGFAQILELVKEIGFFSLRDDYCIISDEKTPRTEISVSVPVKTGEVKTKTVKFLQKDPTIPDGLKKIENKIIEVSGFDNWDKKSFVLEKKDETEIKKQPETTVAKPDEKYSFTERKKAKIIKTEKKPAKGFIKNKKIIAILLVFILIISFIGVAYQYGLFNFNNDSFDETPIINNNNSSNNKTLTINILDTASEVNGLGNYSKRNFFDINETVFVYMEYSNFTVKSNGECNLSLAILVKKINGDRSYNKITYETNPNKVEHHWEIKLDDTWPTGTYFIVVTLTDNITNSSLIKNDTFSING